MKLKHGTTDHDQGLGCSYASNPSYIPGRPLSMPPTVPLPPIPLSDVPGTSSTDHWHHAAQYEEIQEYLQIVEDSTVPEPRKGKARDDCPEYLATEDDYVYMED